MTSFLKYAYTSCFLVIATFVVPSQEPNRKDSIITAYTKQQKLLLDSACFWRNKMDSLGKKRKVEIDSIIKNSNLENHDKDTTSF